MNGFNILIDLVWVNKLKLVLRFIEFGFFIEVLFKIDIVFILYGYYDYLDFLIFCQLNDDVLYFVFIGLKKLFICKKFKYVEEYKWWESMIINEVFFYFVFFQYWMRRFLFDMNMFYWGGWIIDNEMIMEIIYFCGDSGYF